MWRKDDNRIQVLTVRGTSYMVLGHRGDFRLSTGDWWVMSQVSLSLKTVAAEATEKRISPDHMCQELNAPLPELPLWWH